MKIIIQLFYLVIPVVGFSQSFTTLGISSSAGPVSAVFGDFDLDGKKDFIINSGGNIEFYEPEDIDNNVWYQKEIFKENGQIKSGMLPTDIDNDGDTDLIMVYKKNLSVFENNSTVGNLSFTFKNIGIPFEGFVYLDSYDHDGDGDPDLVSSTSNGDVMYIRNDGPNAFTTVNIASLSSTVNKIEFTDIDGNAGGEIVIGTSSTANPLICLYYDGASWKKQFIDNLSYSRYRAFDIADFNNDSKPDIISFNGGLGANGGRPILYINKGSNPISFEPILLDSRDFASGTSILATDVDDNGLMDFISGVDNGSSSDRNTLFYKNIGTATTPIFETELFSDVPGPDKLYATDFDNDGDNDFLYCITFGGLLWVRNDLMVNVKDDVLEVQLTFYPNPTADEINIKSLVTSYDIDYTIIDAYGRIIKSNKLYGSTIDISELQKGSYVLKISNNDWSKSASFIKL